MSLNCTAGADFFSFSAYFSYSAQTFSRSEFSMVSASTSKSHTHIVPYSTNVQHKRRQDEWCSTMPYYPKVAFFPITSWSGLYHSDLAMITMSNLLMKDAKFSLNASCILMRQVSPCYHCITLNSQILSLSLFLFQTQARKIRHLNKWLFSFTAQKVLINLL